MGSHISSSRSVMDSLRRLVHGLRVFDRAAERMARLSGAQLFVLSRLADGGFASVNELARRTCTHQSSVSVVAQRLAKRGLVRRGRSPRDGRQTRLSITAAGRRALRHAPAAAQEKIIAAVEQLPAVERDELAQLLDRLVFAAGLGNAPAPLFFETAPKTRKLVRHA